MEKSEFIDLLSSMANDAGHLIPIAEYPGGDGLEHPEWANLVAAAFVWCTCVLEGHIEPTKSLADLAEIIELGIGKTLDRYTPNTRPGGRGEGTERSVL